MKSRTHYWEWTDAGTGAYHDYLVPGVLASLAKVPGRRVLDLGCGNGAMTARIAAAGYTVTGLDFETSGLELARRAHPEIEFVQHDIMEPLPGHLAGRFDVVMSAEVIEHLFLPREVFLRAGQALSADGHTIVTTPYHGYLKNLAIALAGRCDDHWTPASDYGHIKFFSVRTLGRLAGECGFEPVDWSRVGRIPPLAASMVMTARRAR